ncbi:MAG: ribulose-phosphate 3-epimerase, ribulose-phosphate 3-epimerase [Parcubacteria group bacterium]|nr:ribulose-phosphate 3-epimerase, ribulose-phosphate 3-epimerase [Parcubacteria group bacterium]
MSLVTPAVLPSSRQDLEEKLVLFETFPGIARVQIDVVDGLFVSPGSWPYTNDVDAKDPQLAGLLEPHRIAYEVDLMCFNPVRAAEPWISAGATRLTFHEGSATDLHTLIEEAQDHYGHIVSIGLAIHVDTDLERISESIEHLDYIQCMGIARIGRQGEPLDPAVIPKIRMCKLRYPALPVQVDGGVTFENAKELLRAGASSLIAGSALLKAADPRAAFESFETLRSPYGV